MDEFLPKLHFIGNCSKLVSTKDIRKDVLTFQVFRVVSYYTEVKDFLDAVYVYSLILVHSESFFNEKTKKV